MAAPMAFSRQAIGQSTFSKAKDGASSFLLASNCKLKSNNMNTKRREICMKARSGIKFYRDHRLKVVMSSAEGSNTRSNQLFPSNKIMQGETIKQFYTSINEKDLNRLSNLISDDCSFDDYSFSNPLQGKKEIMEFFGQLLSSMGQNVEFKIGLMCEGGDFTTGVTWHLEWNKKQIPFTRGCSFYECSLDGTKLVIKRAQVLIESPMKPGGSALVLLKILTSLFDAFPKATEWFLESPHVILQLILKIYNMVLGPFISPFLMWYMNLWKIIAVFLNYALKILRYISKILYK